MLGFDTKEEYDTTENPYFGCTVGRVANRIANASFSIDEVTTKLEGNTCGDKHHLHGGKLGFHRKEWQATQVDNGVQFQYTSPDGDQGYPGEVSIKVTYTLEAAEAETRLVFDSEATLVSGGPTPIGLCNHTYFNLAGHSHEHGILHNELQIDADSFTLTDSESIPTRALGNLDEHPSMDFRETKKMAWALTELYYKDRRTHIKATLNIWARDPNGTGGALSETPLGFDDNYVLRNFTGDLRQVACLTHPESKRQMTISTTAPGMQLYTANYISSLTGKGGANYRQR